MFEEIDGKANFRSQIAQFPAPNPEKSGVYMEKAPPNKPISYECRYANGLSLPPLSLKDKKPVIYISVPIFIALHDNLNRLREAQQECHDLITSFNFEIGQLAAKSQLTFYDGAAQYLSDILQSEVYSKGGIGNTALSANQTTAWNLQSGATESDALLRMRQLSPPQREAINNAADDNRMLLFGEKLGNAVREIDFYEREVELDLYLIGIGTIDIEGPNLKINVLGGSWVAKGTVIGTVN